MDADFPMIPRESALFSSVCNAHISGDCPISGHCEGVCTPDTRVCALVRASTRDSRRRWHGQKPLIFMHFHGGFLGGQHEMWLKQHNGKVRLFHTRRRWSRCCTSVSSPPSAMVLAMARRTVTMSSSNSMIKFFVLDVLPG